MSCPYTPQQKGVVENNTSTFLKQQEHSCSSPNCPCNIGESVYIQQHTSLTGCLQKFYKIRQLMNCCTILTLHILTLGVLVFYASPLP